MAVTNWARFTGAADNRAMQMELERMRQQRAEIDRQDRLNREALERKTLEEEKAYKRKLEERAYQDQRNDINYSRKRQEAIDNDLRRQRWADVRTRQGRADTDRMEADDKGRYYDYKMGNGVDVEGVSAPRLPSVSRPKTTTPSIFDDIDSYQKQANNAKLAKELNSVRDAYDNYYVRQQEKVKRRNTELGAMLHATIMNEKPDNKGFIYVNPGMLRQYNADTGNQHLGILIATKDHDLNDLPYYQPMVMDYALDQNGKHIINPATGQPEFKITPMGQETLAFLNSLGGVEGFEVMDKFGYKGLMSGTRGDELKKRSESLLTQYIKDLEAEIKTEEGDMRNVNVVNGEPVNERANELKKMLSTAKNDLWNVSMGSGFIELTNDGGYKFVRKDEMDQYNTDKVEVNTDYLQRNHINARPSDAAEEMYTQASKSIEQEQEATNETVKEVEKQKPAQSEKKAGEVHNFGDVASSSTAKGQTNNEATKKVETTSNGVPKTSQEKIDALSKLNEEKKKKKDEEKKKERKLEYWQRWNAL